MLFDKKYFLFSVIFVLLAVSLVSAGYSGKLTVSKTAGGKIIISGTGYPLTHYCGNEVLETYIGEQCDGSNLGGETCESLDYDSGDLACQSTCVFDTSDCANDDTNGDTGDTGRTSGGSSSSGGGSSCIESWECQEWQECKNGKQSRVCKDINNCRTQKIVPDTIRACSSEGEFGDEALKMLNQSQETNGFFNKITGAVIGGGKDGILVPLLFIIIVVALLIITLSFKKKVVSGAVASSSENVVTEDVDNVLEGGEGSEE